MLKISEFREQNIKLKAENQILRNEAEEKELKIYHLKKDNEALQNKVDKFIDAFNEINKEMSTNQCRSVVNLQNKIRKILATLQTKANIPLTKKII